MKAKKVTVSARFTFTSKLTHEEVRVIVEDTVNYVLSRGILATDEKTELDAWVVRVEEETGGEPWRTAT